MSTDFAREEAISFVLTMEVMIPSNGDFSINLGYTIYLKNHVQTAFWGSSDGVSLSVTIYINMFSCVYVFTCIKSGI